MMQTYLECIPCLLGQALEAAKLAGADEVTRQRVMKKVMAFFQQADLTPSPPNISTTIHEIVRDVTGCNDPYREAKDGHNAFALKVGAMSGKLLSLDDIDALAKLPGREELLAILMGTMKAPVQKFVSTLNEIPSKFVRTLAAVRDSKQGA